MFCSDASFAGKGSVVGLIAKLLLSTMLILAFVTHAVGAAKQYQLQVDPQALAVAQAAFGAMGGAKRFVGYQDSVASGTATISTGGSPVSYPITMKSKGLRETRVELQMPKGTNVRIVNQGVGALLRPDGSVKNLSWNNTFYEHVNHVPILSLFSEYANGDVNVIYKGTTKILDQAEDVIEVDFVPNLDPVQGALYASMSKTLFFVNQTTHLIDKIQGTPFAEGSDKNIFTEELYLSDYRLVNGLIIPFRQTLFIDSQLDTDIKLDTVTFNVGLLDSDFALPQGR